MTNTGKVTLATICTTTSALALLIAGVALAVYLLTPDASSGELTVVVGAGILAVVAGIAGVWLHRLRTVVSVFATIGLLAVGATLVLGAAATLQDAASGGFNNIGASLLLLTGSIIAIPSIALALVLAFFYARDRRRAHAVAH